MPIFSDPPFGIPKIAIGKNRVAPPPLLRVYIDRVNCEETAINERQSFLNFRPVC